MNPTLDPDDGGLTARAQQRWEESTASLLAEDAGTQTLEHPLDVDATIDGALKQLDEAAHDGVPRLSSRRHLRVGVGVAMAAIAASLMVWILRPPMTLLPHHVAEFEGGIRSQRGAEPTDTPATFSPSTRMRWAFTPATTNPVAVAVRIEARGERAACIDPTHVRRSTSGAVEVEGPAGELLPLPPGAYELVALLAPADRMAALADPCTTEGGARPAGVIEVDRRHVVLLASP